MTKKTLKRYWLEVGFGVIHPDSFILWDFTRKQAVKVARILTGWNNSGYVPSGVRLLNYQDTMRYQEREYTRAKYDMVRLTENELQKITGYKPGYRK